MLAALVRGGDELDTLGGGRGNEPAHATGRDLRVAVRAHEESSDGAHHGSQQDTSGSR